MRHFFNRFNIFVSLAGLSLLLYACNTSPDTKEQPLSADLYIRYLEDDKQYKAQFALANADSTTLEVDQVSLMGRTMDLRKLPDGLTRYNLTLDGAPFQSQVPLLYQPAKTATSRQDLVQLPFIEKWEVLTADAYAGLECRWSPAPLQEGESIILVLTDSLRHVMTIETNTAATDSSITVSPQNLGEMQPGMLEIYLVRRRNWIQTTSPNQSLSIQAEYYTGAKTIPLR